MRLYSLSGLRGDDAKQVPFWVQSQSGLSPSRGWVPVGVESQSGLSPFGVESQSGLSPFGVQSHSGFSPIRGWVHSGFSPIQDSVHSGLSPIRGWVHSRFSLFEVQSIRGSVHLGLSLSRFGLSRFSRSRLSRWIVHIYTVVGKVTVVKLLRYVTSYFFK